MKSFRAEVESTLKSYRRNEPTDIHSLHEGYGMLMEKVRKLEEEVFKSPFYRDSYAMTVRLLQLAALCQRIAEDTKLINKEPDSKVKP